jgi:hypothetical protein
VRMVLHDGHWHLCILLTCRLRDDVSSELEDNSADISAADSHIEEDLRIGGHFRRREGNTTESVEMDRRMKGGAREVTEGRREPRGR